VRPALTTRRAEEHHTRRVTRHQCDVPEFAKILDTRTSKHTGRKTPTGRAGHPQQGATRPGTCGTVGFPDTVFAPVPVDPGTR
jgi:hypothetical protein